MADRDKRDKKMTPSATGYSLVDKAILERKAAAMEHSQLEDTGTWRLQVDKQLKDLDEQLKGIEGTLVKVGNLVKTIFVALAVPVAGFVIGAYVAFERLEVVRMESERHRATTILDAHPGTAEYFGSMREDTAAVKTSVDALRASDARNDARMERIENALNDLRERRR